MFVSGFGLMDLALVHHRCSGFIGHPVASLSRSVMVEHISPITLTVVVGIMRSKEFWDYFEGVRPHLGSRASSFAYIFDYLDTFEHPVRIIETGSVCKTDDWSGNGGSTLLFDAYAKYHPGSIVHTIDKDPQVSAACRKLTSEQVKIHTGESITVLKSLADTPPEDSETIELLYLDSYPVDYDNVVPGASHTLQEYMAASPLVKPETLVVVDDAPVSFAGFSENGAFRMASTPRIGGNGKFIAEYSEKVGGYNCCIGQQSAWKNLKAASRRLPNVSPYLCGIITSSPQGIFAAGIEDEFVGKALRETGEYASGELYLAKKFLKPEDQALVVGSHVGTIAIPLSKHCRHVTAIEANPWTFKMLKANVAMNNANVTPLNFAASDKTEIIKFVMNTNNSGGSKRMPLVRKQTYFSDNPEIVDVEAYSLDDKLAGQDFALVFMDIEGSEYFAIKGMQKILSSARVLLVEFVGSHLTDVAGVTPEQFSEQLMPHFNELHVFTLDKHVKTAEFPSVLREMYDKDIRDGCILFAK